MDAGFGFRTRGGQTRGITVTGDHGVPISLPAGIRTWVGRPLRRKERCEQNQCRWDKENHKLLFWSVHSLRPP
jgi:hypothetical protein